MKVILFSFYYCKLRLSAKLGFYKTVNPLDWNWAVVSLAMPISKVTQSLILERQIYEEILMVNTMTALATRTIEKTKPLTILQRIANKDKTAVGDCLDSYGNFIWALARKFTASSEEAEAAAQEIFTDIWRHSERASQSPSAEKLLIGLIARRRLIRYLQ